MTSYSVKTTSFWHNYAKMTSFWRYNDAIIISCVQWGIVRGLFKNDICIRPSLILIAISQSSLYSRVSVTISTYIHFSCAYPLFAPMLHINFNHRTDMWFYTFYTSYALARHIGTHKGFTWWRHQMETFSTLLAICAGNPAVTTKASDAELWCFLWSAPE